MSKKIPTLEMPINFDKMVDMKAEQLEEIVKECQEQNDQLRSEIVKNYQQAQPFITQMRVLKQQLKKNQDKMEAAKTFLSMEKNGSVVSNIDIDKMEKIFEQPTTPVRHTSTRPEERKDLSGTANQIALGNTSSGIKKPGTKFRSPLVTNWEKQKKDHQ